jgi:hypothetical protein
MTATPKPRPLLTVGSRIGQRRLGLWRLCIPEGQAGRYRLAQLDDYPRLGRRAFRWRSPTRFRVRARVSAGDLPGTWGFGLWNDPFSTHLALEGAARRVPALPNAAWFFYASAPNYLALRDDHPAQGLLAATFSALPLSPLLMMLSLSVVPLLAWPPAARVLRRAGRLVVREDGAGLDVDPTAWHDYGLDWEESRVQFLIDGASCFFTPVSPQGPLGLVLWIDNQYMAFGPDGRLQFGALPGPRACLELSELEVE